MSEEKTNSAGVTENGTDEKKKKRRILWIVLVVLCAAVFLTAAGMFLKSVLPPAGHHEVAEESTPTPDETGKVKNPIDFAALQAKNEDTVAYIKIPGTAVDYPVLRSSTAEIEDFYLDHSFEKEKFRAGAIYMQRLNHADFNDVNTVLYGHYMKNGTMFAGLHKFRDETFFNEHEYAYIYTPDQVLTYKIYSAFVYDNRHVLNSFNFDDPEDYQAFLDDTFHPTSVYRHVREGVEVTTEDKILTLSTCFTSNSKRYLVVGVLVDEQEAY